MPSRPLWVGRIGFINTLPVYGPLGEDRALFRLVSATPAELNRMLAAGELEIASISSVACARMGQQLLVLPGLCIASAGAVLSVRVFASAPPQEWDLVGLPAESATSVAMLKILLRHWGLSPRLVPEDEAPPGAARLLIGDRALRELGRWEWELDIAEEWCRLTGTPAVFGVWVVRKDAWEMATAQVRAVHRRLVEALGRGLGSLEYWARAGARQAGVEVEMVRGYYRRLKWVMGERELAGLRSLYRELVSCSLIPWVPEVVVDV